MIAADEPPVYLRVYRNAQGWRFVVNLQGRGLNLPISTDEATLLLWQLKEMRTLPAPALNDWLQERFAWAERLNGILTVYT